MHVAGAHAHTGRGMRHRRAHARCAHVARTWRARCAHVATRRALRSFPRSTEIAPKEEQTRSEC
eukprot:640317-Pleurochrysis_carterae.AAC.1